jgi:hypothetical protein
VGFYLDMSTLVNHKDQRFSLGSGRQTQFPLHFCYQGATQCTYQGHSIFEELVPFSPPHHLDYFR